MTPMPNAPRLTIDNRRRGGWWWLPRLAVAGLGAGITAAAMAAVLVYTALAHDLPRLDRFDTMAGVGVTRFEAADGSLVGERYTERRLALSWEEMPRPLILSFLAAEDARFFEHSGLDFRGIVRAMVANFFAGGVKEGASTITQQLAKILVGSDRKWSRKVKEAILARRMEDIYSKPQILEWYINVIYFGHRSYGVQAAAQNYFRKNAWELTLGEMALLAGCAQSPSRVNPALDLPGSKARAAHILDNMVKLGWATAEEAKAAKAETFIVYPLRDLWGDQTPDFTEAVRRLGPSWSDGERDFLERGLTIRMAVDPAAQRVAHDTLDEALVGLQKKQGYPGPLAKDMTREAFFAKNAKWVAKVQTETGLVREGARVLGRVAAVDDKTAKIELTEGLSGSLELKASAWATGWTIFPMGVDKKGKPMRVTSKRVSFNGKLTSLDNAITVGDIVMLRVLAPPPPPKPKKPAKPKKGDKKTEVKVPEPVVEAKVDPKTSMAFALEPVPMMGGAVVSTPLGAGGIDALATGWDFDRSEIDRSLSVRPTGSTMKPLAYALAYDRGLPPSHLVHYVEIKDKVRIPRKSLAWQGLIASNNPVSEEVFGIALRRVARGDWQRWGETLGLMPCVPNPDPKEDPKCLLQAFANGDKIEFVGEVKGASQRPRGMLSAFATFAREGRRPRLDLVRKVVDRDGRVLERNYAPVDPWADVEDAFIALYDRAAAPERPVISPTTAYLITRNLAEAVKSGTGEKASTVGREAAGKTGTQDYDVWFTGFTGDRAATLWIGADDNERTIGPSTDSNLFYGSDVAAAWARFMRGVDKVGKGDKRPGVAAVVPPDVSVIMIDNETGLALRDPTTGVPIPHRKGTEPELVPEPVVDDTNF